MIQSAWHASGPKFDFMAVHPFRLIRGEQLTITYLKNLHLVLVNCLLGLLSNNLLALKLPLLFIRLLKSNTNKQKFYTSFWKQVKVICLSEE